MLSNLITTVNKVTVYKEQYLGEYLQMARKDDEVYLL